MPMGFHHTTIERPIDTYIYDYYYCQSWRIVDLCTQRYLAIVLVYGICFCFDFDRHQQPWVLVGYAIMNHSDKNN